MLLLEANAELSLAKRETSSTKQPSVALAKVG